jgi:hypothetical protein
MGKVGIFSVATAFVIGMCLGWPSPGFPAQGDCAQPVSTGSGPVATDALFVLRAAVGTATCENCVCDIDGNGSVSASDALAVLKAATGQPISLNCPACSCDSAQAPTCGGSCPAGETCAADPFDPAFCTCLNDCEASAAPTCGGSCAAENDPSLQCTAITFSVGPDQTADACTCAPVGIVACGDASSPECFGVCHPGSVCVDSRGVCACSALPLQPACDQAEAPTCGGTCSGNNICTSNGVGGCACTTYDGNASCFDTQAPMCSAGACAFGEVCSVDVLGTCDCFEPCEVGDAPACSGSCDVGETCQSHSVTVNGSTFDLCQCDSTSSP